jgi:uncharacterized protein YktA (UPF0223 family)
MNKEEISNFLEIWTTIEKYWKNGCKTEDLIKMIKSVKQNEDE